MRSTHAGAWPKPKGLKWLSNAPDGMLTPVNPKDQHPVSVGFVLQTPGFNLGDAEATDVLDRNFDQDFADAQT